MIWIQKNSEPPSLIQYKKRAFAYYDDYDGYEDKVLLKPIK